MKQYIFSFVKNPYFYISFLLMSIFPILNIIDNVRGASHIIFQMDTYDFSIGPYTMWIGLGNGSQYATFLYILLPLLVSIPSVFIYFDYQKSGYHYFTRYKLQHKRYRNLFFVTSLLMGFLLPLVVLLTNFLSMFLIWPDLPVDYQKMDNNGVGFLTFMFPSLFSQHPFIATIINIILVSLYGSMFAVLAITCSVYISKRFICLMIPFVLQILVGLASSISSSQFAWTPAQFLDMSVRVIRLPFMWVFIAPILIIMLSYVLYNVKGVHHE